MKRFIDKIKAIPWWGWAVGFFYFGLQYGLYRLGAWLSRVLGTISYAFEWKIDAVDDLFRWFRCSPSSICSPMSFGYAPP